MKPEPTTPSRRDLPRGAAVPGGTPSSFLSAVVAKKICTSLRRHVADGELAEAACSSAQPCVEPVLQPDLHRLERRERRRDSGRRSS